MTPFRKILVALDRTERTDAVLTQAIDLAKAQEAQLMLLHCFTLPQPQTLDYGDRYRANLSNFLDIAQQQLREGMEEIRQWLSAYAHQAEAAGLKVDWDWRLGEAGAQICHAAADWEAELIVMGRRGRQGVSEALLGSVSNYVLHRAHCSVLVVQGQVSPQP